MWQAFINWLKTQIFMPQEPIPAPLSWKPAPPSPFSPKILAWADAITIGEGANPALNNIGNLKLSTLTKSWGCTPGRQATDGGWLCKFQTPQAGHDALCHLLTLACEDQLISYHNARTLEAFTKIYAGNPPQGYIDGIAKRLGVPLNVDIATFLS